MMNHYCQQDDGAYLDKLQRSEISDSHGSEVPFYAKPVS